MTGADGHAEMPIRRLPRSDRKLSFRNKCGPKCNLGPRATVHSCVSEILEQTPPSASEQSIFRTEAFASAEVRLSAYPNTSTEIIHLLKRKG